jgi:LPXTG-site transpeptidase (sortase) family protein
MPTVGVPRLNESWDVSWLLGQAGWLEGSAFPTFAGNSVLTGHVWDAANLPGPFYNIRYLGYDDKLIVHAWGEEYVYAVREVLSVKPSSVETMLKHEERAWLTLVTCQGYNEDAGEYARRVLVRAVLLEVR